MRNWEESVAAVRKHYNGGLLLQVIRSEGLCENPLTHLAYFINSRGALVHGQLLSLIPI